MIPATIGIRVSRGLDRMAREPVECWIVRGVVAIAAAIGWASLLVRYFAGYFDTLAETALYLSYFSVLSNILAAATLTEAAFTPADGHWWLTRPAPAAATMVYMSVTGLSALPHADWLFAGDPLHHIMPIIFLLFWLTVVPKGRLEPRHIPVWLLFPVVYTVYALIRGPFYPFFDIGELGLGRVFFNIAMLAIGFLALGCSLVAIDRGLARSRAVRGLTVLRQFGLRGSPPRSID